MKQIFFLPLVLITILLLNSCSQKEEDDNIGLDTSPNTFVANLEGEAWAAAKKEAVLSDEYLTVYGEAPNGSLITLQVKLYNYQPLEKAYVLTNTSKHFAAYDKTSRLDSLTYWTKNNIDKYGQSGDIELTKLDEMNKIVSGVFKFRGFNNHDGSDYVYLSQGAFTDIKIVDSLTIDVTGQNALINTGGNNNNEDDDDDEEDPVDNSYVNCFVDGIAYNSSSEEIFNSSLIKITSTSGFLGVSIEFPSSTELGEHDLSTEELIQIKYNEGTQLYSLNPTGTMAITEKDATKIVGSFSVVLTNYVDGSTTKSLTSGSFYIDLTE